MKHCMVGSETLVLVSIHFLKFLLLVTPCLFPECTNPDHHVNFPNTAILNPLGLGSGIHPLRVGGPDKKDLGMKVGISAFGKSTCLDWCDSGLVHSG